MFSRKFNIRFKLYIPMLDIFKRDEYPKSIMINYEDDKQYKFFSWFDYIIHKDNRIEQVTKPDKDALIKDLFDNEKKILKDTEKIIFMGFSQGGRYILYFLERFNIKTKFNIFFKSFISLDNLRKKKENKIDNKSNNNDNAKDYSPYLSNKFYCIYSRNDKFCNLQDGLKNYFVFKNEFSEVNMRINNDHKHIMDYNCIEYLKDILLKEIINTNNAKY